MLPRKESDAIGGLDGKLGVIYLMPWHSSGIRDGNGDVLCCIIFLDFLRILSGELGLLVNGN